MHKSRVLIADDQENMRLTLADILEDEGYEVATAETGERAIEMFREHPYDVILMDVRMPGIDGVEAARRIRRSHREARVIFMSAYTTEALRHQALEEGAVAFLNKPLDIDGVLRLIGQARDMAVLVVEAEDAVARILENRLRAGGYWVTRAAAPADALDLAAQVRFDVVFIDVALPGMNGLDLYLALREVLPQAVVIMLCASNPELERLAREAVRRTAYTVVSLPPDPEQLEALLDRVVGQRLSGHLDKPDPSTD